MKSASGSRRSSPRRDEATTLRLAVVAAASMALMACTNGPRAEFDALSVPDPPGPTSATAIYAPGQARPAFHWVAATAGVPLRAPRIVTPAYPLQCVPFARALSDIKIRGDAWTWWRQANGRYGRNRLPAVGSVLVLKPRGGSRGHVAVVTRILNDREIVIDHANWLNHGRIHLHTPVVDVSRANDWSAVRVWYTPGDTYGAGVYPAHGFIHPVVTTALR